MRDVRENRIVVKSERDVAEVSTAFAPKPAGPRPDPCAPNFIRLCDDPTREEICINALATALRGQVADGLISEAAADKKLRDYIVSLEETPFVPGLQVFMSARKSAEEIRRELENKLEEETGVRPPPPKPRAKVALPPRKALLAYGDIVPSLEATLLGERFLCREGGMLFVGPSGIGKSSASIQQDLLWSIGEPAFGIRPARPLKIIGIQAEDDDGDLYEFIDGIKLNLKLTAEQDRLCRDNCAYYCHKARTGPEFLQSYLRPLLARDRPDIVRLNPLQAYLGGDVKDTALVSGFLRNGLNPLLEEFQCAAIIVCHTPKTNFRTTDKWRFSDWQYAVAGAGDLTNWGRAILVAEPTSDTAVYKFIAAKRGRRIGWENEVGGREFNRYFAHAEHAIFWKEATAEQIRKAGEAKPKPTFDDALAFMPADGSAIPKEDFILDVREGLKVGKNAARDMADRLISRNKVIATFVPRPGARPAVHLSLDNHE